MNTPTSRRFVQGTRTPAVLALIVLCATAVFHVSALKPAEERLRAAQRSLETRATGEATQPARVSPQARIAADLGQFYAFFNGELSYVDWLARFYDAAGRAGVAPQRVEYRSIEPVGVPMVLQEIAVPVTGDYAKIRAFAQGVLLNVPVASMDQITFRRAQANQTEVDADLRFTIYLARE